MSRAYLDQRICGIRHEPGAGLVLRERIEHVGFGAVEGDDGVDVLQKTDAVIAGQVGQQLPQGCDVRYHLPRSESNPMPDTLELRSQHSIEVPPQGILQRQVLLDVHLAESGQLRRLLTRSFDLRRSLRQSPRHSMTLAWISFIFFVKGWWISTTWIGLESKFSATST